MLRSTIKNIRPITRNINCIGIDHSKKPTPIEHLHNKIDLVHNRLTKIEDKIQKIETDMNLLAKCAIGGAIGFVVTEAYFLFN